MNPGLSWQAASERAGRFSNTHNYRRMFYPRAAYCPFKQHKVEGFLTVPLDPLTIWVGVLSHSPKRSSAFLHTA